MAVVKYCTVLMVFWVAKDVRVLLSRFVKANAIRAYHVNQALTSC